MSRAIHTALLRITAPPEMVEQARLAARQQQMTVSEFVRALLRRELVDKATDQPRKAA